MWKLKCLICGATPETLEDQLSVSIYGQLVAMQEHMVDHGISLEAQRQCTKDEKGDIIIFKVKGFDNRKLKYLEARRDDKGQACRSSKMQIKKFSGGICDEYQEVLRRDL